MSVGQILDELETELGGKKGVFGKKADQDRVADLVSELRENLPQSIREAEYIVQNRQRILSNADSVAQDTIREAQVRAEHIVESSELIKRAENSADKIIESAHAQCDVLVDRTKAHLDGMFKDIEQFLLSTLAMIRSNRDELRGAMVTGRRKKQ